MSGGYRDLTPVANSVLLGDGYSELCSPGLLHHAVSAISSVSSICLRAFGTVSRWHGGMLKGDAHRSESACSG